MDTLVYVHLILVNNSKKDISFGPKDVALLDGAGNALQRRHATEIFNMYQSSANIAAQNAQSQTAESQSQGDASNDYAFTASTEHGVNREIDESAANNMSQISGMSSGEAYNYQRVADAENNLAQQVSTDRLKKCRMPYCSISPGVSDEGTVYFSAPTKWPVTAQVHVDSTTMTSTFTQNPPEPRLLKI